MRRPQIHSSRYARLYREASRKGFDLRQNADRSWRLVITATGAVSGAGLSLSLDEVAQYLMTRTLLP